MKRLALVLSLVLLSGCTSATQFGSCIGAFDERNPKLEYKLSGWNVFVGVFFASFIVPPILVVANETFCPVGNK